MLDTLLEASGGRQGVFVWSVLSLVAAGLRERARTSARVSAGRTIAEATKLASVLYVCLWLTAGLAVVVVSVIVGANTGGFSQLIVLVTVSIAGLAVFAVQPRLAVAAAIIWTAIGIELIAFASPQPAPWKLLVATAPAVLAATAARARVICRRAI
jgi:hypothetical protein